MPAYFFGDPSARRRGRGSSDFAGHPQADRSALPALDSRLHGKDGSKFAGVSYVSRPLAKERHPREGGDGDGAQ